MSLTATTSWSQSTGNGTTAAFATGFYFIANGDVSIQQTIGSTTTTLTQGTDYTVTGAGNPSGGTATFGTAPVNGAILTITRTTPLTQEITFVDNDALPAASLEQGLDKLTMVVQEIQTGRAPLSRAFQFPTTEPASTNTILPNQAGRAGKVFSFDNNGNIALTTDIGQWRGSWVTARAYNFRDLFTDSVTQNLYFVTANYTSGVSVAADIAGGHAVLVLNVAAITPTYGAGVAAALAVAANLSGGVQTLNATTYTPTGTTQTIDFSLGNYFILNLSSATGTVVLTFTNAGAGTNAVIEIVQGSTARNCTFPTNTIQSGGGGVTYTASANNGTDLVAIAFKDSTHARIAVTTAYS